MVRLVQYDTGSGAHGSDCWPVNPYSVAVLWMNVPVMDSGPASSWQVTRCPSRSAVVDFPVPGGPTKRIRVNPDSIQASSTSHHLERLLTEVMAFFSGSAAGAGFALGAGAVAAAGALEPITDCMAAIIAAIICSGVRAAVGVPVNRLAVNGGCCQSEVGRHCGGCPFGGGGRRGGCWRLCGCHTGGVEYAFISSACPSNRCSSLDARATLAQILGYCAVKVRDISVHPHSCHSRQRCIQASGRT